MNIGFEEKHLESVAVHLNDTKTREASRADRQNVTQEIENTEEETVNNAVVVEISKNEDETSGTNKLRTEQVEKVEKKDFKDKASEISRQENSSDMIADTQRKLLENFNI